MLNKFYLARSCPDPGKLTNGFREGEVFEYPHKVTFTCQPGFLLVGPDTRKCDGSGEWTGEQPVCKRMSDFFLFINFLIANISFQLIQYRH